MTHENMSRLAHFLRGYTISSKLQNTIYERVHRSGHSQDDPNAIQIAQDAIAEARNIPVLQQINNIPLTIERACETAVNTITQASRAEIKNNSQVLVAEIGRRAEAAFNQAVIVSCARLTFISAMTMLALIAVFILVAGWIGYEWGVNVHAGRQDRISEIAARPDADTWLRLIDVNPDINKIIITHCGVKSRKILDTSEKASSCDIPLWLEGPKMVQSESLAGRLSASAVSTVTSLNVSPVAVFFLIMFGMIFGQSLRVIIVWLKDLPVVEKFFEN